MDGGMDRKLGMTGWTTGQTRIVDLNYVLAAKAR
jgi:hypothetical protein